LQWTKPIDNHLCASQANKYKFLYYQVEGPLAIPEAEKNTKEKSSPYDERQAGRLRLINSLLRDGVFGKIEVHGSLPYLTVEVWVGSIFMVGEFQDKSNLIEVVWAYYFESPEPNHKYTYAETVYLKDVISGKTVGSYSPFNIFHPGLTMK
jgi:hypothetical protein